MIVLVIRSRRPFFKSRPGKYLLEATILIGIITFCFPWTPFAAPFGFKPLPFPVILMITAIIGLYILTAETIKGSFTKELIYKANIDLTSIFSPTPFTLAVLSFPILAACSVRQERSKNYNQKQKQQCAPHFSCRCKGSIKN
jgi:hypothetical protein